MSMDVTTHVILQESASLAEEETLSRPTSGKDGQPDQQPGEDGEDGRGDDADISVTMERLHMTASLLLVRTGSGPGVRSD